MILFYKIVYVRVELITIYTIPLIISNVWLTILLK